MYLCTSYCTCASFTSLRFRALFTHCQFLSAFFNFAFTASHHFLLNFSLLLKLFFLVGSTYFLSTTDIAVLYPHWSLLVVVHALRYFLPAMLM